MDATDLAAGVFFESVLSEDDGQEMVDLAIDQTSILGVVNGWELKGPSGEIFIFPGETLEDAKNAANAWWDYYEGADYGSEFKTVGNLLEALNDATKISLMKWHSKTRK